MATSTAHAPQIRERAEGQSFRIFRGADAPPLVPASERGSVRADYVPHPAIVEGMQQFAESGAGNGTMTRVLFSSPTLHVSYVWFKSGFPLPLHSHDADCFYQVIAGSMRVGTEEVRQGDSILIPGGVPYTATPGDEGVEFLEIRPSSDFDTRFRATTTEYWNRVADTLTSRQEIWATEKPPFGLLQADKP